MLIVELRTLFIKRLCSCRTIEDRLYPTWAGEEGSSLRDCLVTPLTEDLGLLLRDGPVVLAVHDTRHHILRALWLR
jgi:hypothetical protein